MPYMPWSPNVAGGGIEHCGPWVYGPYVSRQINVDANGCNIVGDAANEPSIAIDPTNPNNIVIGWRQFDTIASDFRQSGWAYSHDGGQTWTFPGSINPGVFGSSPVLAAGHDGKFYYHATTLPNYGGFLYISHDHGVTWQDTGTGCGGGRPWIAIDTTDGPSQGNLYCIVVSGHWLNRMFPSGAWSSASYFPYDTDYGTIAVASDGTVFLTGHENIGGSECDDTTIVVHRSLDAPFQEPSLSIDLSVCLHFAELAAGPNCQGLGGLPWIACDPSTGNHDNVYVMGTDSVGPLNTDVMFARSVDGGNTWSVPIRVNDDDSNRYQWFAMMSVAPTGRIDAVWYDGRNTTDHDFSELFYSHSLDGGITWLPNIQVSSVFDFSVGNAGDECKLGDNNQMLSDATHVTVSYAATFNNEQDVYFLRFPAFDCNQNGISDPEDISNGVSFDCDGNSIPDECQLLIDCNSNGIFDPCEISGDESLDCDSNRVPDECQPFLDCNSNLVFDSCDTASGESADCNLDRVPDECEPDCNENSVADLCDITDHMSVDCNFNLVPDECEEAGDFDGDGFPDICDSDIDNDGVANETDICDQTMLGFPVRTNGTLVGDVNLDCCVKLYDYAFFDDCFVNGGPGISSRACETRFGADADGDVDLFDFANFQRVFSGP